MADLIEKPMAELKETINGVAKELGFDFVLAKDYSIAYNGVLVDFASESEQYRAGVILQIAVAKIANTGIIALDYADRLFGPERRKMIELVTSTLQGMFETILLFSSTEHEKEHVKAGFEAMAFQNTSAFWVENGVVEKLV